MRIGAELPIRLERELQRALAPMIRQARATLPKVRTPQDARALQAALRREWSDAKIRALVKAIGDKVEANNAKAWRSGKRLRGDAKKKPPRRVPYDGEKLIEEWSREAAKRITSVRDEIAEGMRRDIVAALEAGDDPSVLASRWRSKGIPVQFGTLEGRVKVIAQNQLGVLHAKVQSARARAVGATDFIWRTQGDDRVRDAHRALEGTRHAYTDPPSEGLPGEPINCRCWAETVVPDELLADLDLGSIFER